MPLPLRQSVTDPLGIRCYLTLRKDQLLNESPSLQFIATEQEHASDLLANPSSHAGEESKCMHITRLVRCNVRERER